MMIITESALRPMRESVEAFRAQLVALSSQSAALSSQSATISAHLETLREQCDTADSYIRELRDTVSGLAASVELQGKQIARLQEEAELHDESVKQLRAGQARLQLQATSDLEEMRAATTALAHQMLVGRSPEKSGSSRAGSQ